MPGCSWQAVVFAVIASLPARLCADESAPPRDQSRFRRPVAMVLDDAASRLYVANRGSGTISLVDLNAELVTDEVAIGRQLADLRPIPSGNCLVTVDEAAHELIVLGRGGDGDPALVVVARQAVAPYPVTLSVSADGRTAYVASLWSRRLVIVDLSPIVDVTDGGQSLPALHVTHSIELPFAPRQQLLVRDGAKLVVADSFGGSLAIIDTATAAIDAIRELPAHNIRGLALDPTGRKLLVSHQILNSLAETTHNDVHWGILLINVLRWLSLDRVLDPTAEILRDSHVHPAGDSIGAGGDPAGLAVAPDGTVLLALAGMGRVAFGKETDYSLRSLPTAARPTAVTVTAGTVTVDSRLACVANTLADSITLIDLPAGEARAEIALGPMPLLSAADRGELLFHDARLSLDGWFSCHSCHTDGHTNGQLADTLGDGSFGAAKRVLTLLGVGRTGPWAWNGDQPDLAGQVRQSIESTMRGDPPTDEQVADLVAYLNTLEPAPPLATFDPPEAADAPDEMDRQASEARGAALFQSQGCAVCHNPTTDYTSPATYDVGLADSAGNRRFNPPSLRGISQAGPYLHDNRARTLEEVFTKHRHQVSGELTDGDVADLVRFLRTL
jgi:cytochrome c peroxidase